MSGAGWACATPEIASNRDVDVTSQVPRDAEHAAFIEPLILLSPSMLDRQSARRELHRNTIDPEIAGTIGLWSHAANREQAIEAATSSLDHAQGIAF
jgi:hypothetical protein